jgi:BirA family biotin operon repressor/biotin-[acetyl-CoA-carboxylase] ligase
MMAALAVHRFFGTLAGDETTIKWPNDIYWRDRKAAGILIENHLAAGRWDYSVIGIGININQQHFDPAVKNPVSLLQITGQTYNTQHLAGELASVILQMFNDCPGDAGLLQQYNAVLYKRNELIRLKREAAHFNCRLKGVNLLGEIEVEGAAQETYSHAEAQLAL